MRLKCQNSEGKIKQTTNSALQEASISNKAASTELTEKTNHTTEVNVNKIKISDLTKQLIETRKLLDLLKEDKKNRRRESKDSGSNIDQLRQGNSSPSVTAKCSSSPKQNCSSNSKGGSQSKRF